MNHASTHLAPVANNVKQTSDLFSVQNLTSMASFLKNTVSDGKQTFKEARQNAKITGKLLAHFLALRPEYSPVFGDHTFSLMGFSLGSQVCKSTINRQKKLGEENLVHNVYFMAGATYIKSGAKQQQQKQALITTISG